MPFSTPDCAVRRVLPWGVWRRGPRLCLPMSTRSLPLPRRELGSVVGDNCLGVAWSRKDLFFHNSDRLCRRRCGGGKRFDPPGEEIGYHKDVLVPGWCLRVRAHQVAGDDLKWLLGLSRFQGCRWLRRSLLDLGAQQAVAHVVPDVGRESTPMVVFSDCSLRSLRPRMAGEVLVVVLV
jgi:hypothetical protein